MPESARGIEASNGETFVSPGRVLRPDPTEGKAREATPLRKQERKTIPFAKDAPFLHQGRQDGARARTKAKAAGPDENHMQIPPRVCSSE